MTFASWQDSYWKWGSSNDEMRARRAWDTARDDLNAEIVRLNDFIGEQNKEIELMSAQATKFRDMAQRRDFGQIFEVTAALIDVVGEYEGLGASEAEMMKAEFVRILAKALGLEDDQRPNPLCGELKPYPAIPREDL